MAISKRICVVTGSRAEYGLLYWLMRNLEADEEIQLQIAVTGMHLSPEFGLTAEIIEKDGFRIDAKVEMLLSSDTGTGIAKSIGLGIIGFSDAFSNLQPDLIVVLGDRFEILAAVQTALVLKIPVAHIAGGDVTEGAYDESIRHSLTKLSHLHFVTNADAAARVRQMGENPERILMVGSPGIDTIKRVRLLPKETLEAELGFKFRSKNLLITYHPVTLGDESSEAQLKELFAACDRLGEDVGLLFTLPNADNDGRRLIQRIHEYVETRPNAKSFTSLGQQKYLSAMNAVDVVVGNSSSGLYEAPTFKKPTVNIGDRQKGRLQAKSVINCCPEAGDIYEAILRGFDLDCSRVSNPYGEGNAAELIYKELKRIKDYSQLLRKPFFEV